LYEPVAHAILNRILDDVELPRQPGKMRTFHTRLGANFYAIYSLFHYLYSDHPVFERQLVRLVSVMAAQYAVRDPALKKIDAVRERDHEWFLSQEWVGMALYSDGFAGNLDGLRKHLGYLQDLGVNLVHIMPILKCPPGASDGGYAVSDFRDIDERAGTLDDLRKLAAEMRKRGMLLTLDVVVNHTSNEHEWAQKARAGSSEHQDYYYIYDSRDVPDKFEETMPEVFPETAPGNFTFDEAMQKWAMTVFNDYQWDLNYTNPAVFVEMLDIVLYWANRGADIIRLDAVAFLWKKIGTTCQNEREAHLILQLLKDCCQVTAPATLFIAEAIVAPVEIIKYFGEDAVIAKECEIAYNATFMALLWDAVATKNTRLLRIAIQNLPDKLDQATWLNYIRCHDDIGLGFDDRDIEAAGYDARSHRKFLVDYFTGAYPASPARGRPFGRNDKTGDARISGSLASLVGLETAIEKDDRDAIRQAVDTILLLHSMIMSLGGIPLLYYGDELGTINDTSFQEDPSRANDSRWIHRPRIDWTRAERRLTRGTPEQRIFDGMHRMIATRKSIPAFADHNNRELIESSNPHLFVFLRQNPRQLHDSVLVVGNFSDKPQHFDLKDLGIRSPLTHRHLRDLYSRETPKVENDRIEIPACGFSWLSL
jgi:amylosucrase